MAAWTWFSMAAPAYGQGATTVDITEPFWKMIKTGAIEEKEIAECLAG